jgi:hypothetical protein
VWCVDFKGDFLLGDKTRCYPLTVSDFESRYLIACTALTSTKTLTARPMFERVFLEFGIPEVIRSDNGVPFSSVGVGGLSPLAVWWIKLGIRPERIEPGHPEQNGRHERMHRTMKAEATKPMQADLASQQRAFDRFRHQYNDIRPHEAIGLKTPLSRYSTSRRSMPHELVAPTYPESMSTRRLDRLGRINVRGIHIRIGPLVANETIGLLEVGDGFSEIFFGPLRLGAIDSRTKRPVLVGGPPKLPAL